MNSRLMFISVFLEGQGEYFCSMRWDSSVFLGFTQHLIRYYYLFTCTERGTPEVKSLAKELFTPAPYNECKYGAWDELR